MEISSCSQKNVPSYKNFASLFLQRNEQHKLTGAQGRPRPAGHRRSGRTVWPAHAAATARARPYCDAGQPVKFPTSEGIVCLVVSKVCFSRVGMQDTVPRTQHRAEGLFHAQDSGFYIIRL